MYCQGVVVVLLLPRLPCFNLILFPSSYRRTSICKHSIWRPNNTLRQFPYTHDMPVGFCKTENESRISFYIFKTKLRQIFFVKDVDLITVLELDHITNRFAGSACSSLSPRHVTKTKVHVKFFVPRKNALRDMQEMTKEIQLRGSFRLRYVTLTKFMHECPIRVQLKQLCRQN